MDTLQNNGFRKLSIHNFLSFSHSKIYYLKSHVHYFYACDVLWLLYTTTLLYTIERCYGLCYLYTLREEMHLVIIRHDCQFRVSKFKPTYAIFLTIFFLFFSSRNSFFCYSVYIEVGSQYYLYEL